MFNFEFSRDRVLFQYVYGAFFRLMAWRSFAPALLLGALCLFSAAPDATVDEVWSSAICSPTGGIAGLTVPEGGSTTFDVWLEGTQPTANVTLTLTISAPIKWANRPVATDPRFYFNSGLTEKTKTVAFTSSNWSTKQNISLYSGTDTDTDDGAAHVDLTESDSTDSNYNCTSKTACADSVGHAFGCLFQQDDNT